MRSYWLWLLLLMATWLFAWLSLPTETAMKPWRLVAISLFLALYFFASLLRKRPYQLTVLLITASVIATIALLPNRVGEPVPYLMLLYSLIAGKAIYRLPPLLAGIVGISILSILVAPALLGYPHFSPMFSILFVAIHAAGMTVYSMTRTRLEEVELRNDALLSEYRNLKRRIVSEEEVARQEERTQIARDIHDSVGHKLTALLMQLEVFRMQADEQLAPAFRN